MRKTPVVAALRTQRAATLGRLATLSDAGWELACLPGWRVRDVAAHLLAVDEASLTGRLHKAVSAARDRREFESWNEVSLAPWSDWAPGELIDALERCGDRLARFVARTPSALLQMPLRGWYGRQPLLFLHYRRVLDEWVHECDIAWADGSRTAGDPVIPPPEVPDVLAAAVLSSLPHLGLSRGTRTSGVVRLVVETGEDARRTWSVDFARRQYGSRITARPDAVVRTDACTLALVAEGRVSWEGPGRGRFAVEGDDATAMALLDVVAPAS